MGAASRQALGLAVGSIVFFAGTAFSAVLVQPRSAAVPVALSGYSGSMTGPRLGSAPLFSGPVLSLSAPGSVVPLPRIEVQAEKPDLSARVAAFDKGFAEIAASPAMNADAPASEAHGAGQSIEKLLTGEEPAPSSPATEAELSFAAEASLKFALAADDVGAQQGLKAGTMKGRDFLGMLAEADKRLSTEKAPSPRSRDAAAAVRQQVLRVVRALLKPDEPLGPQIRRVLSVWQVFNQEMTGAAEKGLLEAVEAEARLFAEQVEASV
ncbi:MAG: hypothetical protein WC943_08635 [Elusimicrobiota bacterium]|jgi:hypothetical protein